ncbi:UvrABC system protein A [Candidatus Kinetoplastibacterium sorsogonicusi]|uniref:UvrABC system protein A n=1 Tax=Candidatus Kinetoplastidibacterium kentomonadis TaxID=1576550 RepID=A0A3Q8EYF5_9PROT|nr:excinuclease ABC subunit UvrA [Candidatus Kinetoplastibacterium sorsogonicusi]AWD32764.1 UvrABC system protein A [Candidatus Kinetoplastibacterium sorsogonicusi]
MDIIDIHEVCTNNLKNVSIKIPKNKFIVITGVSGSGKSSLAFNTIYAESQRRYIESISLYARKFLKLLTNPKYLSIKGLSPAIAVEQNGFFKNSRSTVSTITEIKEYLKLLYSKIGILICMKHNISLSIFNVEQITNNILTMPYDRKIAIIAPFAKNININDLYIHCNDFIAKGFMRFMINGVIIDDLNILKKSYDKDIKSQKFSLEIVIDRLYNKYENKQRIAESIEIAINISKNIVKVFDLDSQEEIVFTTQYMCPKCQLNLPIIKSKIFSTCIKCYGSGFIKKFNPNLLISSEDLSIANGAIKVWDMNNVFIKDLINSLAKHYSFNIHSKYKDIPDHIKNKIFWGSKNEKISFTYTDINGHQYMEYKSYEGLIPNLQRQVLEGNNIYLEKFYENQKCHNCNSHQFKSLNLDVFIFSNNQKFSINTVENLSIEELLEWCKWININPSQKQIVDTITLKIINKLSMLINMGLGYLSLNRPMNTLSLGEQQRIKLTNQMSIGLSGITYILDEPSIGLHKQDIDKLISGIQYLKSLGNTIIVIEYDKDIIMHADWIIEMGPGAGVNGGNILANGTYNEIIKNPASIIKKYINTSLKKNRKSKIINKKTQNLILLNATGNNLKDIDIKIPIGYLTCVTGISGSGKSSLIIDTLSNAISNIIYNTSKKSLHYSQLHGVEFFNHIIVINQENIGKNANSNVITYIGIFDIVRNLFANTNESRKRGYKSSRFSFNLQGGRCEFCTGHGKLKIKMDFLADIYQICDYCNGNRFNKETLEIKYKGLNISEILNLTISESIEIFKNIPEIFVKISIMHEIGLSHIKLGQDINFLSMGELHRLKLTIGFTKYHINENGKNLYVIDEPTIGLHFQDIEKLINIFEKLINLGHTIVIIENNISIITVSDWIIELGPGANTEGGYIMFQGVFKELKKSQSDTAKYISK